MLRTDVPLWVGGWRAERGKYTVEGDGCRPTNVHTLRLFLLAAQALPRMTLLPSLPPLAPRSIGTWPACAYACSSIGLHLSDPHVVALIGVWSPPFSPQPPQRSCILLLDYLL
eukprot:SAG11_NODE_131_length_15487_cov_5.744996_10_plen_113_part_00